MFLTPLNYVFSLQLVPVYEWEPVDAGHAASSHEAPPPPCPGNEAPASSNDAAAGPSDLRLVFKGYEWRSVAQRSFFPREDWESIYRSEADEKEKERDPVAHRHEPLRRAAPPRPDAAAHDGHGVHDGAAKGADPADS